MFLFGHVIMNERDYINEKGEADRKVRDMQKEVAVVRSELANSKDRYKYEIERRDNDYQRKCKQLAELEHKYEKLGKECRHLEAEIERLMNKRF